MNELNRLCSEVDGVGGLLGLDQIEWSAGNAVWKFWECSPCCGNPVNINDALCCIGHWLFLSPFSLALMLSTSHGQSGCTCVPHTLCTLICFPGAYIMARYNIRKRSGSRGSICGDIVCDMFCPICAFAQMLRSTSYTDWRLYPFPVIHIMGPTLKCIN